jgi:acyl-coenzyme A thioesterase PaaI-like protein
MSAAPPAGGRDFGSSPPFFTRYGLARTGDRDAPMTIEPYKEVCRHGALRATVIAAAVDLVGSLFTREAAGTEITTTTDLSLRIPEPGCPTKLTAHGRPLRTGRSGVVTEVELVTSDGPWAYGQTSFARMPRPESQQVTLEDLALPAALPQHPLTRPLEQEVGVQLVDANRGSIEVELRPALLNPEGAMQGALVALLIEVAAEQLAEHDRRAAQHVVSLDLRYLSTAKRGPVVSRALWIGTPAKGMMRVELRDRGRDDRLTAAAIVGVVPVRNP